jgi:hypothetical protein
MKVKKNLKNVGGSFSLASLPGIGGLLSLFETAPKKNKNGAGRKLGHTTPLELSKYSLKKSKKKQRPKSSGSVDSNIKDGEASLTTTP